MAEITKIKVPVKALNERCLRCPSLEITCNEIYYGKEIKQTIFECKNLKHCLFLIEVLKDDQKKLQKG